MSLGTPSATTLCTTQGPVRIAIVGCGAMVEQQHLPSLIRLAQAGECQLAALVERDRDRAEQLAARCEEETGQTPAIWTDHHDILPLASHELDAALVGLPNHLHAPIGGELLQAGLHVLVEKPIANTVAECDTMIAAAKASGAILAVGHMRRFSPAGRFCKWAISSGLLGEIESFDIQNGFVYTWPVTTDYLLHKEKAGGGVLIDLGVHTLDQMLWWLGDVSSFVYYDDDYGGVEADCKIELTMESGARGVVQVSRTRDLRETAIIRGTRAQLEVSLVLNQVSLCFVENGSTSAADSPGITGHSTSSAPGEPAQAEIKVADLIAAEHRDFIQAIQTGSSPAVSGDQARRSLALVEACYANRQTWRLPWTEVEVDR